MNNTSHNHKDNQIRELEKRVQHLEEINRFTLDALELASTLMDFQPNINKLESPEPILEETCARIFRLIEFQGVALYLVNEKDSDFYAARVEPDDISDIINQEVSNIIEQGFFNWSMQEVRPLILATSIPEHSIVLHVMTTNSRVRGMFVGLIKGDVSTIADVSWALLSIILSGSANALESYELYSIFRESNVRLKKSVLDRTQQLEVQASYDQLTHLPNRDMILKKLERKIRAGKDSDNNYQVAFILIDLDMFKEVNESLGHEVGDKLLVEIGFRLQELMDGHDNLARLGGDEFAIIITHPDAENMAKDTARQVIQTMKKPFNLSGQSFVLDLSIGISIYPRDGKNLAQILSKADVAMYASKRRRTGYTLYDAQLDSTGINRLCLMGELKQSLDKNELTLYFQPKISLSDEKFSGAEALVRWIHPQRGFIPPGEFIPLAEQGGLIKELTLAVLDMAVSQIKQWQEQRINIPLSINLSVRDLQESHFPDYVARALKKYDVSPEMLEMEITESAFMTAPGQGLRTLNTLNQMGIKLGIDDFGTGYSSISYLKELPVQVLKIDRSFVMNMDKDESDAKIVNSIIHLGHNLDLKTVAEGVENLQTFEILKKLGCDMAQGYFIMKPSPANEFLSYLLKNGIL